MSRYSPVSIKTIFALLHMKQNRTTKPQLIDLMVLFTRSRSPQQQGYVMVMTAVITLIMFSILMGYLLATSMNRNVTNVQADVHSSFYTAESGLNRRAQELREKFDGYRVPSGSSPANLMQSCLTGTGNLGSGDLGCTDYQYRSVDASKAVLQLSPDSITSKIEPTVYIASTYVQDNPNNFASYPVSKVVPTDNLYAGMNMQEYTYRVFATARKSDAKVDGGDTKVVLQMEFNSRLIPLFQFAVFYNQDLEIRPSPPMTITGRIHTNSNLYLGSYESLTLNGNTTSAGNIYVKNKQDNELYGGSGKLVRVVVNNPASPVNILAANSGNTTANPLSLANLKANFGNKLLSDVDPLKVPSPGFLGKTDAGQSDGIGQYYGRADLRISYQPNNAAMPVAITAIKTGAGGNSSTCATVDNISLNRNERSTLLCETLTTQQIQSLRQPVMLRGNIANETRAFCPTTLPAIPAVTLSDPQKIQVTRALQTAISSQSTPIAFSQMNSVLSSAVATSFDLNLQPLSLLPATITTLKGSTHNSIAALVNGCFLAAPIQIYGNHYNGRELRNITLLQTDIRSLSIWNRDNIYVGSSSTNGGQGFNQDELLFERLTNPVSLPKYSNVCNGATTDPRNLSLRCLGLGSADTSEGGMLIHATVDKTQAPVYPSLESPYGFAFIGGHDLPGALTIATDQAAYIQGDYNYFDRSDTSNPSNPLLLTHPYNMSNSIPANGGLKEPASVLSDSINILSNACLNTDRRFNCGIADLPTDIRNATATYMNVALLAGTDITTSTRYSGSLQNYPRLNENWGACSGGCVLKLQGSFVSLNAPLEVNSNHVNRVYYFPPQRNWDYDSDFNDSANLPPLTPRLVYLNQNVFKRL